MQRIPSDAEWVDGRIANLPPRWQKRLRRRWEQRSPIDFYAANVELREATESLLRVRLPLDATDAEICDAAEFILAAPAMTGQMIALDGGQHLGWGQVPAGGSPEE